MKQDRFDRNKPPRHSEWDDDDFYDDEHTREDAHWESPRGESRRKPAARQSVDARRGVRAQNRRQKRRRTILLSVILALLLVIGGVAAAVHFFPQKPTVNLPNVEEPSEPVDPDKPTRLGTDRREDFFTFLIIGRDTVGGGNTDTILLAAYDVPKQNLSVMSLPRDTMINVSWDVKKLNSVYNQYKNPDDGIEALDEEVAQLVGFVPDFQVVIEWKAVGDLVDAIGGVRFDVPRNMYKVTEDVVINLKKGEQELDGKKAMQLVRYRDYADGDLTRVKVQQDLIKAVLEKCLQPSMVTRIDALSKVFSENVKVNLSVREITWFATKAITGGLKAENMYFCTMPCLFADAWSRTAKTKLSYVVPKTEELVALVNERFNPYLEPLQSHELDIMAVDEQGKISSSSGTLEDSKANKK